MGSLISMLKKKTVQNLVAKSRDSNCQVNTIWQYWNLKAKPGSYILPFLLNKKQKLVQNSQGENLIHPL